MTEIALTRLSPRNLIVTLVGLLVALALAAAGWSLLTWSGFADSPDRTARVLTLDGRPIALPAADRPTVVYFFRPGCDCQDGMRQVVAARRAAPDALYVAVALPSADSPDRLRGFVRSAGANAFAVLAGDEAARFTEVWPAAGPGGYQAGSTLILDTEGRPVGRADVQNTAAIVGHLGG